MTDKKPSLEEFAEADSAARFEENQRLVRERNAAQAAAAAALAEVEALKQRLGFHEQLDAAQLSPPDWLVPKKVKSAGHRATLGLIYADAHCGEVVDPAAMAGLNAYDLDISRIRHEALAKKTVMLSRGGLGGADITYEGAVLFSVGDGISGIIHEELERTNAATVLEQVLFAAEMEAGIIRVLVDEFGRVHVVRVPGNHGRSRRGKPQKKTYAKDNFDWFVGKLLQREFLGDDRVTFTAPESTDAHVQIYGTRFLVTHGNQFRGGSGISGAMAPLLLGSHRKTRKEMAAGRPYDLMVMGHFHHRLYYPSRGILMGGCLKGYDEHADDMNLEPEEASQELFLITPERGVTFTGAVGVVDRAAEGW